MEAAINHNTKAIIPVDLAGVICDYDRIFEAVERQKSVFKPKNEIQEKFGRVIVMADGAHAFGARRKGKMCGEIADFTNFSFHAVKNMTTAEGGAAVHRPHEWLDEDDIYKQYMLLSLHGQTKDAYQKNKVASWEYDVVDTQYKCNMPDVLAALGVVQLQRYEKSLNAVTSLSVCITRNLRICLFRCLTIATKTTGAAVICILYALSEKMTSIVTSSTI